MTAVKDNLVELGDIFLGCEVVGILVSSDGEQEIVRKEGEVPDWAHNIDDEEVPAGFRLWVENWEERGHVFSRIIVLKVKEGTNGDNN